MSSHNTPPVLRNPAPHRGFNAKAREVLLDSPMNYCMRRSGSDEEFLRRVGLVRFRRAGSEEMGPTESGGSTPGKACGEDATAKDRKGFDELNELPRQNRKSQKSARMLLSEVGKTRSVGDLSKRISRASISIKTLQQQLKIKVPSSDSKTSADELELISPTAAGGGADKDIAAAESSKRTAPYKMQ